MTKPEIKRLDDLWKVAVKLKADYKCEVCGKDTYLNAHHIVGRRNFGLRWEVWNGVCLCSGHHTMKTQSAHQDPLWFDSWLREHRKVDYAYINASRNRIVKYQDYDMIKSLLDKQIKKYTKGT